MKQPRQLLIAGAVTASVIGGGAFALTASAQSDNSGGDNLASKIAENFNLNKDEVQNVIAEHRSEHRSEHLDNKLSKAVEDGKITDEQKSQIHAYLEENKPVLDDQENVTREQRREAMKTFKEEFQAWAEDNGIDPEALEFGQHKGHHRFGEKGEQRVDE